MMTKNNLKMIVAGMILATIVLSACGGPRKCNGSRGTHTEMGVM